MTSITEQYLQLIDEFIVAQARVKQTAADLIAIGQDLNRERVGFLRPGKRWPTSEDIVLKLRTLEDARAKLLSFYSTLSAADRIGSNRCRGEGGRISRRDPPASPQNALSGLMLGGCRERYARGNHLGCCGRPLHRDGTPTANTARAGALRQLPYGPPAEPGGDANRLSLRVGCLLTGLGLAPSRLGTDFLAGDRFNHSPLFEGHKDVLH
jgi:hypothetical protein